MDVQGTIQTWLGVVTAPNDQTFEELRTRPDATLGKALLWVVIAAVIATILAGLRSALGMNMMGGVDQFMEMADLPPDVAAQLSPFLAGGASAGMIGISVLFTLIWTPIAFIIGVGIYHLLARLLGGTGQFDRYAFSVAAFAAPLSIVNGLLAFVPILGGCVAMILGIYQIVLTYFATKVEHNLSSGRAIAVILIPVALVILLVLCMVFGLVALLVPLVDGGS